MRPELIDLIIIFSFSTAFIGCIYYLGKIFKSLRLDFHNDSQGPVMVLVYFGVFALFTTLAAVSINSSKFVDITSSVCEAKDEVNNSCLVQKHNDWNWVELSKDFKVYKRVKSVFGMEYRNEPFPETIVTPENL